jgi:hypothetical protein
MRKLVAATIIVGSIAVGVQAPSQAEGVHHQKFHSLYYVTHKHHHKVWVDISGNGWKSKEDAVHESKRLLRWLESIGY